MEERGADLKGVMKLIHARSCDHARTSMQWDDSPYKRLIQLRKENAVIVYGEYRLLLPDHSQIYVFTRSLADEDERLLVILNISGERPVFELPEDVPYVDKDLVIANYPVDPSADIHRIELRPWEARVYRLPLD